MQLATYPGRYPRQHERPQVIGKQHLSLIYTAPPQKLISPSDNSYNRRYFSSIGLSELSVKAIIFLDQKCGVKSAEAYICRIAQ